MSQRIPQCPFCSPGIGLKGTPVEAAACESNNLANSKVPLSGVVKPDIVFFGETLPPAYFENVGFDREEVDLIIVIGTSLQVPPVARIPSEYNFILLYLLFLILRLVYFLPLLGFRLLSSGHAEDSYKSQEAEM